MRAMILAAGLGTRLRPLTDRCPKPLLPLMFQPLLGYLLEQLQHQGVRDVAINLHHQATALAQWLRDGRPWGLQLLLSYEPEILGTAGGIKQVEKFLRDEPFLVLNADVLMDLDLRAVWQWHCAHDAMVTMVVRPDPAARTYGAVVVDAADRVLQINGRPQVNMPVVGQETVFTGVQVVSPAVLRRIPPGRECSTTADIYPALITDQQAVYGYRSIGYWLDVGVPERYLQAHWDILNGALGTQWQGRLLPGTRVILHDLPADRSVSRVAMHPPVVLAEGVTCAPGACVGPYAVLGAGCHVGAGAVVHQSVIGEGVRIGVDARVSCSILGAGVQVPAASRLNDVIRVA
jgi:NDP-sugar pyrophosphorylase family protein